MLKVKRVYLWECRWCHGSQKAEAVKNFFFDWKGTWLRVIEFNKIGLAVWRLSAFLWSGLFKIINWNSYEKSNVIPSETLTWDLALNNIWTNFAYNKNSYAYFLSIIQWRHDVLRGHNLKLHSNLLYYTLHWNSTFS